MNTYLKYWGKYEVLQMKLGDLLLLLLLFIGALWDPARHCYDFIRKFGFLLYWLFHTYSSQFVLMCFCVYILILPLCCVPHLLIFLKCSLVFVILPVSTLLPFMLLFSEPCLLFYYSSPTEDPLVFCLPIVWWWWWWGVGGGVRARSPRHTIEVLTTYLLQFFLFIIHFVFCVILHRNFFFWPMNAMRSKVAKTAKSELRFCFFVILLFRLPQLVSIRKEDLQTNPDHINYISTRLWLQEENHHTIVWCNPLSVLICRTSNRE